jgi:hypothetical protein
MDAIGREPDDAGLVEVRTAIGVVSARWRGEPGAAPGTHDIEWQLDEEFWWGINCTPVEAERPCLRHKGREVSFQGRLGLDAASVLAHLELAGAVVFLGHIEALPEGAAGPWVEIHLDREKIKLYPYQV